MGQIRGSGPADVEQEQPTAPEQAQEQAKVEAKVLVETTLSQDGFRADDRTEFVARVHVRPEKIEGLPKPAASVALVLDTSGSMAGEPIEKAKAAALEFVDALDDDDQVSLVVFHSFTETLVPLRTLDDDGRKVVREAIEGVRAEGTTDLLGGLSTGNAQLQSVVANGGLARVVLLSDGQPNEATNILPIADQIAAHGITVTALGLGLEYDEALLGKIAQKTGGKFHFAESPDQVAALFRDEVLALDRIVGRSAVLTLLPGPGVKIERVLGPAHSTSPRGSSVQVGDLVEQRERDVFVLLSSKGHTAGATIEVLDANLSFYDPLAKVGRTERSFASTRAVDSTDDIANNQDVELMTARALAADDALAALALARGGNLKEAKKRVAKAIARAKRDAARFDDDILRKKVKDLSEVREVLPEITPPRVRRPRRMAVGSGRPKFEPMPAPVGGLKAKRSHATAMSELGF